MTNLNWKKVGRMLWIDMSMRRKRILMLCLIVMGASFALLTYGAISSSNIGTMSSDMQDVLPLNMDTLKIASMVGNSQFAVFIASLVVFSGIFSTIEKQSDEIRYLMLPASALEKWVSRVAYVVIVGWGLVQLSYFIGVMLWCGAASLLGSDTPQLVLNIVFYPQTAARDIGIVMPWAVYVWSYCISFFCYTFFILCGTYHRHNPWLYSLLWGIGAYIFFVIAIVVIVIVAVVNRWWTPEDMLSGGKFNFDFTPYTLWALVGGSVMALLGIFFLWLSYRRFSRRQLERKRLFTA